MQSDGYVQGQQHLKVCFVSSDCSHSLRKQDSQSKHCVQPRQIRDIVVWHVMGELAKLLQLDSSVPGMEKRRRKVYCRTL